MALTFNLPSQIVVQTAAQWAVDVTVYSNKRILVTSDAFYGSTDQRKFKIADGVQTWSNLDYMPIEQVTTSTIGSAINGAASATPNDTDLVMSVESSVAKKNTWTQIKAFLKTYFDTVYATASALSGKEDTSNKSSSYTASSTTTYANTKALVDGLATKLNAMLFKTNVNYAHTGTTNETVLYSTSNLAGNFDVNDIFRILLNYNATSNGNNKTVKIYLGNASQTQGATFSASGTTQLATYLTTTNGAMKRAILRNIQFMNSLSSQQVVSTTTNGLDNDETALSSAGALSTMTWDYSTTTHLIVTGTLASAGDTINFLHFRGQIIR